MARDRQDSIDVGVAQENERVVRLIAERIRKLRDVMQLVESVGRADELQKLLADVTATTKQKSDARGRRLCFFLRHDPSKVGGADEQGWVSVAGVLKETAWTLDALEFLVNDDSKNRYEYDKAGGRIRARQGHSIGVDLGLAAVAPPSVLYHGTTKSAWEKISQDGLKPMTRDHVHLSPDVATAVNVADRRHRASVVLRIDAARMAKQGHKFYCSTNGVWLTGSVHPDFIVVYSMQPGGT